MNYLSQSNYKVVSKNYTATPEDYYIGVNSTKPVTITLPDEPRDGQHLIVKAEMTPPLGVRQIFITTKTPSTIDGQQVYTLSISYKSVMLFFHDGNWFTV